MGIEVRIDIEDLRKLAESRDNFACIGEIGVSEDELCEVIGCEYVELCKAIAKQLRLK